MNEIERVFSPSIDGSDINRINRLAGIAPTQVSAETLFVLKTARLFAEHSGGAFNPCIGPLVSLWGIGTENERVPAPAEIDAALPLLDFHELHIDDEMGTVFLAKAGMALDLGAIVKGYAADEAARILREKGVKRAIIDLGGNITVLGGKQTGILPGKEAPWHIGIQNPAEKRGIYSMIIPCRNTTLVTSGTYERFFEQGGKRYHHILSMKDGFPVDNELQSVTIAGSLEGRPSASMFADALSTSVFALGYTAGLTLLKEFPGFEAIFIFKGGEIRRAFSDDAFL
ncbi:MAG: FAD:protein FMN transferase [Spirochaetaceae bacterium]|nr:FAD:protein FMN transferase [Spirochaetaceae bacterium]